MSGAKQLAYALIDALNACGIEEEFSYRFLAEMNDILRKENKELELQNEAKKVTGHDKELQQNIIMLMKEYGLTAIEALELVDKLSKPKVKITADLTNNIHDEVWNNEVSEVLTDVYTSGEDPGDVNETSIPSSALNDGHKVPLTNYEMRTNQEKNFKDIDLVIHTKEKPLCTLGIKEVLDKCSLLAVGNEINLYDKLYVIENVGALSDMAEEVYIQVKEIENSEDPGDTHKPSKGSGTRDYERILKQLDWALDTKLYISHYRLFNEIKEILKEHQVQNARAQYDVDKHTITNGYIETKPLTGVYDKNNKPDTMPIETVLKYKPEPLSMYANGKVPEVIETVYEAKEAQLEKFKHFAITFMQGDEVIKSTDIHEALQYVYLLCEGYMAHIDKRRYRMKEILMKQFPSHEVIVKVEEVKRYE